ncbi:hypothetical protein MLN79_25225, partial [Escherichia coli]|nr:hypothetical protein [Escherichia coli]
SGAGNITFITDRDDPVISGMNDIRLKFRTAVRVTVPVTDGWPDAIACTQSAQTDFSGTVKQTGTPGAQVIIRNGTTPRQRLRGVG